MGKNYLFLIIFYSSICFYSYDSYSINSALFNKLIVNRCFIETRTSFQLINGQNYPVGSSIENLISLIEKIEFKQPRLNAKTLVVMILKRFHLDGVKYYSNYTQCRIETQRRKITEILLPEISTQEFPEDVLTEDEKCNLFYTISHSTHTMKWSKDYEETPYPREDGVASFHHDPQQAISVNRLLMGIAAGLSGATQITVHELINKLVPNSSLDNVTHEQIDPIMAVTISDSLGIDSLEAIKNNETSPFPVYDIHGMWNTTNMANITNQIPIACSTCYRLLKNTSYATLATARGGLDGYSIGKKIQEISLKNPNISLSQIVRMYYSQNGLLKDTGYCTRESLMTDLKTNLEKQMQNYARVWKALNNYLIDDSQIVQIISQFKVYLLEFIKNYVMTHPYDDNDFCTPPVQNDIISAPFEASSDVFIMIDVNGQIDEQSTFITELVRHLDLRPHGSSVTILANAYSNGPIPDRNNYPTLTSIAYNTTSSQFASCRVIWFDKNCSVAITNRTELFELIYGTLTDYESKKANFSGVSSKSFIAFNYNTTGPIPTDNEQSKRYNETIRKLKYEHRDIPFFMLAYYIESVSDLLRYPEHFMAVGNNSSDYIRKKAKESVNKMYKVPSTLQHNECHATEPLDRIYEGYITPGYKQYWAMYPEYFIESRSIEVKFAAEKAKIKVCYHRQSNPEMDPGIVYNRCEEAKEDNGDVIFNISSPCNNKTLDDCDPLYFIIYLSSYSANNCIDARCKSFNQVKFTSTHSGIKCKAISSSSRSDKGESLSTTILIGIVIAVLIPLIGAVYFYHNKRFKSHYLRNDFEIYEINQEQNPTLINVVNIQSEPSIEKIEIKEIILEKKTIGHGSFGVVKKGNWRGNQVAVKIIEQRFSKSEEKSFQDEVKQLSRLSHPNIIKLFGVCSSPRALIMEYADGGSLYNLLHFTSLQYSYFNAIIWMLQCARGVSYLHNMKIIHRDLKSPNLLLVNQKRDLKICDFGRARDLTLHSMTNVVGTPAWIAPEVISGTHYNEKCDVYSWAIIFWEVLARREPYENLDCLAILFAVANGLRPELLQNFPDEIRSLLIISWEKNPNKRPSMDQIEQIMNDIVSMKILLHLL